MHRTVTYPEFPNSNIVFDAEVRAVKESEWSTSIRVDGSYDGPTDVVGVTDYELTWHSDGKTLFEEGKAKLILASGATVQSEWRSEIVPTQNDLSKFPREGERVRVSYSDFELEGDTLRYEWEGTVELLQK